jgi:hypothetical protein
VHKLKRLLLEMGSRILRTNHHNQGARLEKQDCEKKNAEVLLEPNPNSTEESYKITAVFEG